MPCLPISLPRRKLSRFHFPNHCENSVAVRVQPTPVFTISQITSTCQQSKSTLLLYQYTIALPHTPTPRIPLYPQINVHAKRRTPSEDNPTPSYGPTPTMNQEPSPTDLIFNLTWRYLSHAAVPTMLPATALDTNGSIPRSFCPDVYDGVRKTVGEMREEGQWAVWYWVVGPEDGEDGGRDGDGDRERERVGWHPCFRLPANR